MYGDYATFMKSEILSTLFLSESLPMSQSRCSVNIYEISENVDHPIYHHAMGVISERLGLLYQIQELHNFTCCSILRIRKMFENCALVSSLATSLFVFHDLLYYLIWPMKVQCARKPGHLALERS